MPDDMKTTENKIKKHIDECVGLNTKCYEKLIFSNPNGIEKIEELFQKALGRFAEESHLPMGETVEGQFFKFCFIKDGSYSAVANYCSKNPDKRIIHLFLVPDLIVTARSNSDYFEPCFEVEIKSDEQKRLDRVFYVLTDLFSKSSCELILISS
ncbi:hypothetical protein JXA84_01425 [candidate division WOR-3 bacterium]|nr:hypothetical protein [candidate division WOR-3 bacterium]